VARTIAKDYDKKRGQILKTAAQVFAESGFDRASMSQLAKACNISKANIYHYYDSKDALLFGVLDTYLRELRDRLKVVNGAGGSPDDHLRELVKEVLMAVDINARWSSRCRISLRRLHLPNMRRTRNAC
jgi:AcrR family transcriptional regulator